MINEVEIQNEDKEKPKKERPPHIIVKNTADYQRMKLEKLMKNPEKPVIIPERPKERGAPHIPDFVRNVMGSSAGAGSGEFHVYRHLRRKEYARQKYMEEKARREKLDNDYKQKLEDNKRLCDERTAKKREKRLKKKKNQKKRAKKLKTNKPSSSDESAESSEDEESERNKQKSDSEDQMCKSQIQHITAESDNQCNTASSDIPTQIPIEEIITEDIVNDSPAKEIRKENTVDKDSPLNEIDSNINNAGNENTAEQKFEK
ncbi:PRKR-interacting protein 1 homolog [Euwallacea fornicatus]|uniref:PRKR-interacting protein 1 homolog n=1 Tax=Euwallacea fornicatus TaxID=995702 RepID=UPI00338FDA32